MVKKLILYFTYSLFFILALMYFVPKSSVYYLLEHKLEKHAVILSSEKIKDTGLALELEDAKISFRSVHSVNVDKTTLKIFVLYNSINLSGVSLSCTAKSFIPLHIENVQVVYSIFSPLDVNAHAVGEFGELEAKFNIFENTLHLELKPSKVMLQEYKSTMKNLIKTKNGEFIYDKTF